MKATLTASFFLKPGQEQGEMKLQNVVDSFQQKLKNDFFFTGFYLQSSTESKPHGTGDF